MIMLPKHIPVLLDRVLETLGDINDATIIDCTFGNGGYSRAFLERGANVIAFDRDPSTQGAAADIAQEFGDRFKFINEPFSHLAYHISHITYHAIVFDFGISSMQIDDGARGFSFRFDGPLDMRMGGDGMTAAQLIEKLSAAELANILREYGDVKKSKIIANAIKAALPRTTFELKDLIHNPKDVAPVFQALRIAVNDELGEIERALSAVPDMLNPNGMCICVTFHSLEDRIVKNKFREWTTALGDPRMPSVAESDFESLKTFTPSDAELDNNPRARSAHMRAVRKK